MSFTERIREYRQRHRENHNRKVYESPIKRSERAPIARGLMDVVKQCLDNTPEYSRALAERRTQLGDDSKLDSHPIEFHTEDGHFSVRDIDFSNGRGTTVKGYSITFGEKVNAESENRNLVEIKISVESNTPPSADVYGHLHVGPLPYDIGNFSFSLPPERFADIKLIPNSPHTRDVISETVRRLLPTFDNNRKIGISEK